MTLKNPGPDIGSVGKAIANDALVYFLIKQLECHGGGPLTRLAISELKRTSELSINTVLKSYGARAERAYDGKTDVHDEFNDQLDHLEEYIGAPINPTCHIPPSRE